MLDEYAVGPSVQEQRTLSISLNRHSHLDRLVVSANETHLHARGQLAKSPLAKVVQRVHADDGNTTDL